MLINQLDLSKEEKELLKGYNFLTSKPVFLVANYGGEENEIEELKKYAEQKKFFLFPLAVKLEEDMEKLSGEEKEEMGLISADFSLLTEKIKQLLGLKTFFTVGEDETKSWLAKKKMNARECAGLIHSDIEKNFNAVEVYNYET